MTWTTVDADVALEVAAHEALVREAYRDSVNVWTWCVGMTNATGHTVSRYKDNKASIQHCMNIFIWALRNYSRQVEEAFRGTPLTKAQFAAACSFHWNTGAIKRAAWVTHFKQGRIAEARRAFMNWRSPAEIIPRRQKERDLFFNGTWTNDGTMLEFTRVRKPSYYPDWTSGRRINVRSELQIAFGVTIPPIVDQTPKPDNRPEAPTLSPEGRTDVEVQPEMTGADYLVIIVLLAVAGVIVYLALGEHIARLLN